MAEALWRLRGAGSVRLITAVGDDADGHYLVNHTPGLYVESSIIKGEKTPSYTAVLDSRGECALGLGDMTLHNHITPDMINQNIKLLKEASLVVLDGNPPLDTIEHVIRICDELQKPVFFEPTDRRKAVKPLVNKHRIMFASPNRSELISMAKTVNYDCSSNNDTNIDEIIKLCFSISKYVQYIIVTLGVNGVVIVKKVNERVEGRLYTVKKLETVINVSGAGDCFASGFISSMLAGYEEEYCVAMAVCAAHQALLSKTTVPFNFVNQSIEKCDFIKLI